MNGRNSQDAPNAAPRRTGRRFYLDTRRGKGSHVTLGIGERKTIVKYGEIRKGALNKMLKDLGIDRENF